MIRGFLSLVACIITLFSGCLAESDPPPLPLEITDISPISLRSGGTLSIQGAGFGIEGLEDQVTLSGKRLNIRYWSDTQIDCLIPDLNGQYAILIVSAGGRVSEPVRVFINDDSTLMSERDEVP